MTSDAEKAFTTKKEAYLQKLRTWTRKDLLRACREAGMPDRKLAKPYWKDRELAGLLWIYVESRRKEQK